METKPNNSQRQNLINKLPASWTHPLNRNLKVIVFDFNNFFYINGWSK